MIKHLFDIPVQAAPAPPQSIPIAGVPLVLIPGNHTSDGRLASPYLLEYQDAIQICEEYDTEVQDKLGNGNPVFLDREGKIPKMVKVRATRQKAVVQTHRQPLPKAAYDALEKLVAAAQQKAPEALTAKIALLEEDRKKLAEEVELLKKAAETREAVNKDHLAANMALNSKHKALTLERDTLSAEIVNLRAELKKSLNRGK